MERRGWKPNATIEAAREVLRRATQTVRRAGGAGNWWARSAGSPPAWRCGSARPFAWQQLAGSAAGNAAARKPRSNAAAHQACRQFASPPIDWPAKYVAEADEIFDAYRAGSDPALHDFDWRKAEICLQAPSMQGRADDERWASLRWRKGYAALERLSVGSTATRSRAQRVRSAPRFRRSGAAHAAKRRPALAMARIYVYSMPDLAKACAEFAAAEKLGAKFGPREIEEQADAWRIARSNSELRDAAGGLAASAAGARALHAGRGFDR